MGARWVHAGRRQRIAYKEIHGGIVFGGVIHRARRYADILGKAAQTGHNRRAALLAKAAVNVAAVVSDGAVFAYGSFGDFKGFYGDNPCGHKGTAGILLTGFAVAVERRNGFGRAFISNGSAVAPSRPYFFHSASPWVFAAIECRVDEGKSIRDSGGKSKLLFVKLRGTVFCPQITQIITDFLYEKNWAEVERNTWFSSVESVEI